MVALCCGAALQRSAEGGWSARLLNEPVQKSMG